jgi:hypothetical protein
MTRRTLRITALDRLAFDIRVAHGAVKTSMRESLTHARAAGELLIQAKGRIASKRFMDWVKKECQFSHSTANIYMRIAREWDRIEANSQCVANLGLAALDRWLRGQAIGESDDLRIITLFGHSREFVKDYRRLVAHIEQFLELNHPDYQRLRALLPHMERAEKEQVRDNLEELQGRVNEAIAHVRRHISGEIASAEQARYASLLDQFAKEDESRCGRAGL